MGKIAQRRSEMSEAIKTEPTVLVAFKTTPIAEAQKQLVESLVQFQEYKNYFDEQEKLRIEKISGLHELIKGLGGSGSNEDERNAFNSYKPKALYEFKRKIDALASLHLLAIPNEHTDDYRVDTDYITITADDIKPIEPKELLSRFHCYLPKDLQKDAPFPESYIAKFGTGQVAPINCTIKELWNLSLSLTGANYRVEALSTSNLSDGGYTTPFFTIQLKNISTEHDDFFEQQYKARIQWTPEMVAILEQVKELIPKECEDDGDDF